MASQPNPFLTVEEYIALETRLEAKYEYYFGEMFPIGLSSPAHVFIHANLMHHLATRLQGTPCRALGSDLRIHIQAAGFFAYSDVSIFCGALAVDNHHTVTNPKVLFEILSPSSRRHDKWGKTELYRQIPSLEEYVMVEQDCYSIDRLSRQPNGGWQETRYQGEDATLELTSVNITVPLKQIYADVPFELAERDPDQP